MGEVSQFEGEARPTIVLRDARMRWAVEYADALLLLGGAYQLVRLASLSAVGLGPLDGALFAAYLGILVLRATAHARAIAIGVVVALFAVELLAFVEVGFLGSSALLMASVPVLAAAFFRGRLGYAALAAGVACFAIVAVARLHGGVLPPSAVRLVDARWFVNWLRIAAAVATIAGTASWLVGRVTSRLEASTAEFTRARDLQQRQARLRMTAEEELAKAVLRRRQSRELEASGLVSSGVAHDLRNAIGVLQMWAGSIAAEMPTHAEVQRTAARIVALCQDATRVTADVMGVVRPSTEPRIVCSVREQIDVAVAALRRALPADIAIVVDYAVETGLNVAFDPAALLSTVFALTASAPADLAREMRIRIAVRPGDEDDGAVLAACVAVVEVRFEPPRAIPEDRTLVEDVAEAGGRLLFVPALEGGVVPKLLLPSAISVSSTKRADHVL